ncbi:MAG TPA: SCO family protein [Candidatus Saccharimonadia bacterium]|nr:SCO family protein [Candidatus Saccharimonadia bacterium]
MSRDTSQQFVEKAQRRTPVSVKRPWWLWGVCVLVTLVGVGLYLRVSFENAARLAANDLPRLWEVPDFALIERSGQSVTRADLLGKVWIASIIFTRCAEECPLVSNHMARLQATFAAEPDVRLVSITVDPAYDTPEVLTRYAQSFAAQPQRWLFLTGDKVTIYRLVREGFRLGLMDPQESVKSSAVPEAARVRYALWQLLTPASALAHGDGPAHDEAQRAITHSARLVLVDRQSQVRHLYTIADQGILRRLPSDVRLVLQGR